MKKAHTDSLVLLSGGLDSSANLAMCVERDRAVLALTADYGQKAAAREAQAAANFCRYYGVEHRLIDLRWLGALGGSSLTVAADAIPDLSADLLDNFEAATATAKKVWVPNRNGVLINVAAAVAERLGAGRVVVGFNREEAVTFPDNSVEFLRRASSALAMSTANGVEVFCYTAELDKIQIVAEILKLDRPFPFECLWSCYYGGQTPCGTCESCQRSARALAAHPL